MWTLSGRKGVLKTLGTKPRDLGSLKAVSIDTITYQFPITCFVWETNNLTGPEH